MASKPLQEFLDLAHETGATVVVDEDAVPSANFVTFDLRSFKTFCERVTVSDGEDAAMSISNDDEAEIAGYLLTGLHTLCVRKFGTDLSAWPMDNQFVAGFFELELVISAYGMNQIAE